jgi:hypothetical protein
VWPVRVRSMTGLIPLCAVAVARAGIADQLPEFGARVIEFLDARPEYRASVQRSADAIMLAMVGEDELPRVLERLADETEFLSPHGLRSLSAIYRDHPYEFWGSGQIAATVDYEPAESTTALYGGNSNWRGPIWFPINVLLIDALQKFHHYFGDTFTVECPTGSGRMMTLSQVAVELSRRLSGIFLEDMSGRRAVFGTVERFQHDPNWHDYIPFHEYFNGDTGAGVGASHQTGWTALVAKLLQQSGEFDEGEREGRRKTTQPASNEAHATVGT